MFRNQNNFSGYNSVFPQIPISSGIWNGPYNTPQLMLYPNPAFNPYYYANLPANQWALPNPNSPIANIRNIPQPPIQQYLNQTQPYPRTYPNLRQPTTNNPFMNIPQTAFDTPQLFKNYDRYESTAYPTPKTEAVENKVETDFVKGMFQDPAGKLFERNNSQRQFYSVPVGSVPNDQTEFAEFLYGNEFVCKAGSTAMRYGVKYTNDSLMCNGFNTSTPTNFGRLK